MFIKITPNVHLNCTLFRKRTLFYWSVIRNCRFNCITISVPVISSGQSPIVYVIKRLSQLSYSSNILMQTRQSFLPYQVHNVLENLIIFGLSSVSCLGIEDVSFWIPEVGYIASDVTRRSHKRLLTQTSYEPIQSFSRKLTSDVLQGTNRTFPQEERRDRQICLYVVAPS